MKSSTVAECNYKPRKNLSKGLKLLVWGISLGAIAFTSRVTLAAEHLKIHYGPLEFSLSVDALELYAEEGTINPELSFYTKRLDKKTVKQLRRILRRRINIDPILLYRLARSPMAIELLQGLGDVATTHRGHNGFYALRGSLTLAAMKHQTTGVTLIDILREFPGEDIWIDTAKLWELRNELTALVEYREAIIELVIQQAQNETTLNTINGFLPQKDLRTPGDFTFIQKTITINSRIEDTTKGIRNREPFRVRLYLPQGLSHPAPVVVLSHGFGSEPKSFDYLGEHLASYGIVAVSVEHIGSDSDYELEILEGAKKRAIAPSEFIERPLDIHYVLDELERLNKSDPILRNTLNLNKVGAIGHSLGGYTTLALAGAQINSTRLRSSCPEKKINLNISLLMQCRAQYLTSQKQLADRRIKGVVAISPIASGIFGRENLQKISIPTAIMSGSEDIIAPVVQEQVYPFTWLPGKDKYLAMMIPADHFSSSSLPRKKRCSAVLGGAFKGQTQVLPTAPRVSPISDCIKKPADPTIIEEFVGKRLASGQPYIKAFCVAFVKAHIEKDSEYLPYLSSSYARNISSSEIDFNVVRSLKIELLNSEFGDVLPVILPTLINK